MLVAVAAAIATIDQAVGGFATSIPTASVRTIATAGIKTMKLKRRASAAPIRKLTVESISTLGTSLASTASLRKVDPNTLILRERDRPLKYRKSGM